ncbi:DNA binding protein [Microbacterium phage Magritte]|nr:DNA binding protein [Microbacterium phage Magritte]
MRILNLPKGQGKTKTLVQLMIDNTDLVYVASNAGQADNAYRAARAESPGIDRERFRGPHNLQEYLQGRHRFELLVDELDAVLETLLGARIHLATRSA